LAPPVLHDEYRAFLGVRHLQTTSGHYHVALAHAAHANGLHVYVLNPARVKFYARSQPRRAKTDREDAKLLADYVSKHLEQLHEYEPPREAVATLRALVRRREQLIKMLKQEGNRIGELDEDHVLYSSLSRIISVLRAERAQVDTRIDELIEQDRELAASHKQLRTIPQVGRVLAMSILSEMGDGKAFEKAKDVTAWLGLAPLVRQSGTSVNHKGRISYDNHI
jgi:transposase